MGLPHIERDALDPAIEEFVHSENAPLVETKNDQVTEFDDQSDHVTLPVDEY